MYKIKTLSATNFKFFFGTKEIHFDRKHVLIYGENGSGKSSIYWALHCFLHSTLKPDVDSVQKYFKHITQHEESIRNRYAADNKSSSVEVTLSHKDSRRYADIRTKVSDTTVNTQTVMEIKLMTLSSELINYKVIYNMYLATNRSSIKLFDYFKKNLLEFINFNQDLTSIYGEKISKSSLEWWRYIAKGMTPYTTMSDPKYHEFQSHVDAFNQKLSDFLQLITEKTNQILSEDFKENFKVKFKYTPATFNEFNEQNKGRNRKTLSPEIELIVELPNITGRAAIVERPQSYLNEARLSSIAISIRLAILEDRYLSDAPKVMVLDDLLLSLDLGNRESVLKMLLKKYSPRYQLIILTHDKVFFDCVLNHLSEKEQKEDWKIYEMYETEDGHKKIPAIIDYKTPYSKALSYFKGINCDIDYNACGNNQRQALEEIFKKQLNYFHLSNNDGSPLNINSMMIGGFLVTAKELYPQIKFDTEILDELEIYSKQSLNPSSHHNPRSNFYKKELERIFEIIGRLEDHIIKVVIPYDSILSFKILCWSGSEYNYKVKILDDLRAYKKPDEAYYFVDDDKRDYQLVECNGEALGHKVNSKSLHDLYNETCSGLSNSKGEEPLIEGDIFKVYSNEDGKSLLDLIAD
jgi:energy-coupling factor transporter ATP-binding protein EcfA2